MFETEPFKVCLGNHQYRTDQMAISVQCTVFKITAFSSSTDVSKMFKPVCLQNK